MDVNITDDDYKIDDVQYGFPEVDITTHYTNDPFCVAEFRGECAYKYWLIFKLVPIMLHVLGFVLQCLTWRYYKDFTPQQRQYDTIIAYRYPDLYGDCASAGIGEETQSKYRAMFDELLIRPSDSIFSFIEIVTVFYVWGELWFPPIYCGSVRPLSLYYYPILMTTLELTKFNIYICIRICTTRRYVEALFALINADMFVANLWISAALAGLFVVGLVKDLGARLGGCSRRLCSSLFYDVGSAWPASSSSSAGGRLDLEAPHDAINPMTAMMRNSPGERSDAAALSDGDAKTASGGGGGQGRSRSVLREGRDSLIELQSTG